MWRGSMRGSCRTEASTSSASGRSPCAFAGPSSFLPSRLVPAITWATFKPIRVLAPQFVGLTCTPEDVCIDDVAKMPEVLALRFVSERVDRIAHVPRFVFCSQAGCAQSFGFTYQGAYHVGTSGVVIGPRGWQPYFVRHELIHHVQMEHIGSLHALFFTHLVHRGHGLLAEPRPAPAAARPAGRLVQPVRGLVSRREQAGLWGVAQAL